MRSPFAGLGVAIALAGGVAMAPGCASLEGARLYGSGTQALDRGDTQRAISDLERAVVLVPHASEVHNHLGVAYEIDGRLGDAAREFQRAVDLDCENLAAVENLAAARRALGEGAPGLGGEP